MKTKISHLGRSTVSVILAVMMLLSTMLIGTITTANAVDLTKFSKVYLDANVAKYNANTDMQSTKPSNAYAFDGKGAVGTCDENANTTSDWPGSLLKSEGNGIYSILVSNDATKIIFNSGKGGKQTGNLILPPTWKTTPMIYRGSGTDGSNGWEEYTTSVKVADSVTLTANPTSVKVGKPVTLTPKVSGSKLDNLNYTYNKISGGAATEVKNADNSLTVTPTVAGTYKYTVTVSPDSYSPVTSIEASFTVTDSVKYYIGGRFKGESWNPNRTDMQFVKVDGESNLYKYETNMTVSQLSQNVDNAKQYFFIHTGNGNEKVYYASSDRLGHTFHKNSINNQLTLKYYPTKADDEKNYIKFDDVADSSSNVVLYLDTSDKDNLKLYYSADIEPDYRITGNLSAIGEWNGYDSALKFDTAESDGSYSKVITVTDDDVNNKFFKLIKSENGSDKYYGPNDSTYDIISSNSSVTAYDTFEGSGEGNDFYFSKAGTYKIHYIVKTGKNTPSVWVEENTTKYNVTVAENIKSIASVDKTEAAKGEKVTVTATSIPQGQILNTVTVVGEDGSTPIETTVSGNTATFTMPDQDVTVTNVTFRDAKTYTVTFSSSNDTFGTVSATNGATPISSSPATVTEGDTVTFTAKPESGYTLSDWTVTANGTSNTYNDSSLSLKITANTTVVANFKVEDSGTIVNDMYFLYGSTNNPTSWEGQQGYNNSEYGKYDVYKKDGKYIVTLNKEHYKQLYFAFSTSNYYKNMTPKDKLAGVNPDNPVDLRLVTTGKESFNADNTQYVFGMMSIVSENSEYIGDIKIIYDPTANTYTVKATKDSVSDTTVNIVGKDGTVRANYYGKTTSALGDTKLKVTSPDGTTITAIDSCNFDGHCQGVTAKKVPYGSTVTVTTTINPDATFAGHNGSEYYVKGFSINGFTGGVLTQQDGSSHTDNVYEYTFTVKDDVYADVSTIEITPIYFLKNDSNCVTFYVENFMEAKAKWGDTIACYAYYSSGNDSGNALGDYPGQPMVNAEGSIYMQIPKHIGNDTANVVKGITLNNYVWDFVHVSGGDDARKSKNCQTYDYDDFKYLANMSQVNSSDSASDIKNIVYRFKYHTYNNTSADAGNVPNDTLTATTVDNAKYEVFVDYYDKPTDIFGTIIKGNDAVTVDTVKTQSEYLTIVSDGYVNYYKDSANYLGQYATKWYIYNKADQKVAALPPSALLYGLTKSSSELENLVNQDAVPTDFMSDSGASTSVISGYWASFKLLYNSYAGKYAIINYESAIYSSGRDGADVQPGERCDGRWYYSVDNAKITGDIKIEYANTLDNFTTMTGVKTDTFIEGTATGKNTAAEAYFTSPAGQSTGDKPTHVETTSDNSENFKFTVGATSSTTNGYTFVGWYRLIDDTYKAVNDPSELNKTTGQVARNANVVLVARYIKTPGGSMTFHHSLYNGTNAGGGKATTEIQVVVKSSDGNIEYYNSGRIDSTASIDKKTISDIVTGQQDAKITVTLYTTTKNLYDFKGYYSAENTTDITAFAPTTDDFTTGVSGNRRDGLVTTSEYTFSFNDYYTRYSDILTATDAGTVYYNFYSDITSIKVPYKVQFSYTDRMGDQKYYNKAGYVDPENTSSYTIVEDTTNVEGVKSHPVKVTLTDSFILSLAPYESNFTKNLTWDNPKDSKPFDSSVTNSIASAVVKSTQSDRTIHLNVFLDKDTKKPTSRDNKNGAFELFTKDGLYEFPYGSVFYTKNPDGTYTYDIKADKTYTDENGKKFQFMYWAIYSDQDCKNLVIKAYNSEGHFSYVAYDNCWIVPVYGKSSTPVASVKEVSTSTQFMEVTRNQWTAKTDSAFAGFDADSMNTLDTNKDFIKGNDEDKLYADFVLNFFYNGKQLSVFDPDSSKVQTGIVMQKLKLENDSIGVGYNTDMKYYANKYINDLPAAAEDAKNKILTGKSSIESLTKQINNDRLDNKNRLQYYARFNNTETNANCVYRVYTYIKYVNESNDTVVELGDPIYFTLYDVANATV